MHHHCYPPHAIRLSPRRLMLVASSFRDHGNPPLVGSGSVNGNPKA